ncbi:hypothetical protein B0H19DRAFT_1139820 [Mycena capillaripes]|nr:hypothetical protein B0H19DRAFT_1139820 [Mycena capillaripes]
MRQKDPPPASAGAACTPQSCPSQCHAFQHQMNRSNMDRWRDERPRRRRHDRPCHWHWAVAGPYGLYRRPPRSLALWCTMPISIPILLSSPPVNHDQTPTTQYAHILPRARQRFCWCSSKLPCSSPWCVLIGLATVRSPWAARDAAAFHHDRHSTNDFGAVRLCPRSCIPPTPHSPSWDTPPDSRYPPRAASDTHVAASAHQYAQGLGSGAETPVIRPAAARSAFLSSFRFVSFPHFLAWRMACMNSAVRYCATSVDVHPTSSSCLWWRSRAPLSLSFPHSTHFDSESGTLLSHSTARTMSSERPGSFSYPSLSLRQVGSGGVGALAYITTLTCCVSTRTPLPNSLFETRQSRTYFALSRPTSWDRPVASSPSLCSAPAPDFRYCLRKLQPADRQCSLGGSCYFLFFVLSIYLVFLTP